MIFFSHLLSLGAGLPARCASGTQVLRELLRPRTAYGVVAVVPPARMAMVGVFVPRTIGYFTSPHETGYIYVCYIHPDPLQKISNIF